MADQDNIGSGQFVDTSTDPDLQLQLTRLQRTRAGFLQAANQDPDVYAQARRLAQTTGQPIDSILRNPKPAQQAQAMGAVDWDSLETVAPTTAQMFRDRDKANLVGRDGAALIPYEQSWISKAAEFVTSPVRRGLKRADILFGEVGYQTGLQSRLNTYERQFNERVGLPYSDQTAWARQRAQGEKEYDANRSFNPAVQEGQQRIQNADGFWQTLGAIAGEPLATADMVIESMAMNTPQLAATAAAGVVAGPVGMMAASGAMSYATEYAASFQDELSDRGINSRDPAALEQAINDPEIVSAARKRGAIAGVPVATFDMLSAGIAGKVLRKVATADLPARKIAAVLAEGGTGAALGMGGEGWKQVATGKSDHAGLILEGLAEAPMQIAEAKANFVHAGEAAFFADNAVKAAEQAGKAKAQFDKLSDMAKADKVLQRAPELIEEMVQNATQDSGASHIYISANDLHQSGMAVDVAAVSPTVAAEIRLATVENGLIAIPAAEYATRIAPQQWAAQFNEHIRETPDSYSAAESANIIKENGAQLKGEFDAAMREISQSEAFSQSAAAVKENILGQLKQLGVHSDAVNEGYATAFASYYATRAKQLGETPEAFAARRPLQWQAQRPDGSGVVAQASDYTQGAEGQFTPTEQAMKRWRESVALTPASSPTAKATLQTPTAIKAMGEKAPQLEASVSMIAQVAKKHPDVPVSVFENLPALLADPLYVYGHKDGGLSVVIDATTAKGEPLVVGVRDGRIRTVTPSNDDGEAGSGMARVLQQYEAAKGRDTKVYARNKESPSAERLSAGGAYRANSVGQVSTRRATVIDRARLVKNHGEDFYQSAHDTTLDFAGRSFEDLAAEYAALPETEGGHIIDTDLVRELSPEYRADRSRAADIHEAASALTKQLYAAALARPVADGKDAAVLFLAGGGGSGKSFVRESALGENTADITLDGTFSNLDRAKSNIEAALASGREARIVYVYRPPELAVQGVITRAIKEGRPVPIDALAKAHAGAPEVVKAIAKLYDGDARVNILSYDNSGDGTSFPTMAAKDIPHVSEQNALDTFASAFGRAFQSGQIPQRLYDYSTRKHADLGAETSSRGSAGELSQSRGGTGGDANAPATRVSKGAAPLGSFNPDTFTITLLKGANLSTALHEGAHFFFENDLFIAGQISAEAQAFGYDGLSEGEKQILRDASTLLKWHGIDGDIAEQLNRWHSLSREEIRAHHERTAESFERYLLEGKAPSLELQSYFSKFRAWMVSVYSSLKNLLANNPQAGELNPEVRGVFDRMLATNEEIALAQQARGMMAMFDDTSDAGMQPAEFAAYQALGKEATNTAIEQLQAKGLKDMAWLHRTKSKAIKRLGKEAAQLRGQYRHEAARQIMGLPVYQAWQFLTRRISTEDKLGKPIDPNAPKSASINPAADTLLDAIAKLGGISEAEAKRLYGVSRKEFPLKDPSFGKPVIRKTGGLGVDELGEALAENGYLPTNEHGQFDADDFEERFMNELGGIPQYSVYYDWDAAEHRANARAGDQVPNPTALGAGRLDMGELQAWPDLSDADIAKLQAMRMTAKSGLHPDIVTDIVPGFGSGDEMLQAILQAKDPHTAIEELVDARMLMEHGELSTPEAIDKAADAAVFNEARLKFAAAEANALAKATGQRSVLLAAAKQFAAERIARSTIRNILPGQYAAASARAAKEAQAASKRGDTADAAAQKRNELMHSVATKAAYDALSEVDKAVAYFKRVLQSQSISHDARAQIEALLGRYDLRTGQSLKAIDRKESLVAYVKRQIADGNLPDIGVELLPEAERAAYFAATATLDADGNYIYADDAMRLELLAGMLDDSAKTHYKNLSMEQLRGLRETVQQIEHLGRLKDKLLNAKDGRTLNQRKDDIANSIRENARKGEQMQPTRDDLPRGVLRGIKRFASAHIRMAIKALVMDGGKDGGAMWEHFILPLNEAFDKETSMTADLTAKLNAIFTTILKEVPVKERWGKGKFYAGAGGANLNWGNRFAILLNMGNESNMQRLLSGGVGGQQNLTLGQVMPILSEFSTAELHAAQQVWDLFESLRPQIGELERLTKGKEPQWIPARPLTLRSKEGESVTLRGGYFPVVFDPQMSIKESENKDAEAADATKRAAHATNTTRQSFTKQRVEEVKGMPLLLTLDGLYRGLGDVVHDLSFRTAAIDTSRLLRSKRITDAMAENYGMDRVKELRAFIQDMVAGQNGSINAGAKILQLARQNVAMAGLGLNIMNWLQQPLGISNSIIRLGGGKEGAKWLGRGLMVYFNNPLKATREAQGKSAFMQDRGRTRFRELNEIRNKVQVESPRQKMAPYMMSGMIWMQQIADTITWHAAVEKATANEPTMPEERIYAMADQVVRDSQGSGHEVDLARIERGDEVQKIFTVFFNFMNTGNNLAYLSAKTGRGKATFATDMLLAFVFPVITGAIFKAMAPGGEDEDKDPVELLQSLGGGVFSYMLSGVFFFREFGTLIDGYGYKGPGGLRLVGDTYSFAKQAEQGEVDDAFRKAAISLGGSAFGLPAAQINRTWTGAQALSDGETDNPAALVFGFQKQ